jgi:SAM-dependent methyltransferase
MGLFKKYVSQTRKPEGFMGKMMIRGMNSGHAKMADWGIRHIRSVQAEHILEIGCGGGRNVGTLLDKYPESFLTAVDYSELSVSKAAEYNKKQIGAGRCKVLQADVSSLPFENERFDLATAFETIYFWPGLKNCFSEVARVLKSGGTFMIVNESDGEDSASQKFEKIIDGMKTYTPKQIKETLQSAGFHDIEVDHYDGKPWITVIARKK